MSAKALAGLVVGLVVNGVFLWLAVRSDLVLDELRDARLGFVLAAVVVLFAGYALQAARWRRIADTPGLGGDGSTGWCSAGSPATTSSRCESASYCARGG